MNEKMMNSVITLTNGDRYVMIDSVDYNGTTYYLANEVNGNKLGEDMAIFKAESVDGKIQLVMESDLKICEELIRIFDSKM